MEQGDSNLKVISGFLAGVLVAGGVAYLATNRHEPVSVAKVEASATSSPASTSTPVAPATEAASHASEAAPLPVATKRAESPRASAMPPTHPQHSGHPAEVHIEPKQDTAPVTVAKVTPSVPSEPIAPPVQVQLPPVANPPQVVTEQPHPAPKPREPQSVTVTAGTLIPVRLNELISSEKQITGDTFSAVLSEPLVINGFVIAERGSRAEGRLVDATRAGKVKGVAHLALELTHFNTSDGQRVKIQTAMYEKDGESSAKKDAGKVAAAAGIGAIIGGIAGGGKGAVIGAGAGGGAAEGGVLLTRGKPAVLPVETRISFRITDPVTITEKLR